MVVAPSHEILFPFLDLDWVTLVASVPVRQRLRNSIQIDVLRVLDEKLLEIEWTQTRLPMSAHPWRVRSYNWLSQRINRLTGSSWGVKKANHYYGDWINEHLWHFVHDLLSQSDAANRQFFRRETITRILLEHAQGQRDWQHLLAALVVFELATKFWTKGDTKLLEPLVRMQ